MYIAFLNAFQQKGHDFLAKFSSSTEHVCLQPLEISLPRNPNCHWGRRNQERDRYYLNLSGSWKVKVFVVFVIHNFWV